MIVVEAVTHAFDPDPPVLVDVSVTLHERRIGVIGANGSGKTTFARLLNGLVVPTKGRVTVDGFDTRRQARDVRARVGFLFQDPDNQIVMPLVEEDVAFSLKPLRLDAVERQARVGAVLERYGLSALRGHPAHALSGGQKQLLALSSVLVRDPAYLVLDEPTTLLDLKNRRLVEQAIDGLDATVVCVSHDLDLMRRFDRILVFEAGRLVFDGPADAAISFYVDSQTCC
ncbi:MAG: ABC transporter ATP-binding protein [Pseudomonadota bacterium]